jgi:hypothetical protein
MGRDLPFSAQIQKFIDAFVQCQDLDKAAIEASATPEQGRIWWRRLPIKEEIQRRLDNVKSEVDKIVAKRRIVTVDALDTNLMRVVSLTKKDIKESPTLAASKVKAIELGYQRTGILIDGNFIPDAWTEANKADEAPRIFRAAEQSIITHQITETHQTVTTRAVAGAVPPSRPAPSPPTIDAELDDPWAKF